MWAEAVRSLADPDSPIVGNPPLLFPPLPSHSLPLPSPSPFPSFPLEVRPLNTARGSGERCKLPQRGLGLSLSGNRIWCILCTNFTIFYRAMHVVLARYCYRKSAVRPSVRLSVPPSVTLLYRGHIGWTHCLTGWGPWPDWGAWSDWPLDPPLT